ncbi:uncharacterized protein LOC106693062 [Microplitis demolitor]|uniref:uncharacterized protein LOC106693062 n=1 Tax=Microplitis demolitor TaxID=69319 RepID=UPI0004CCF13C|nr:uncharacterized protein LOC106693062 [Microplitis demolitor]XP_053594903.1 uncharacterized protein LOC106693062 [Microplitis demolitor]XP_053594904.1 uncharacterized protein LOC106693062 [Microplitis demolitor]XP_053594905.1 uncharacterized protein LOC106693062 [Microplitis demolitor]
MTDPQLANNTSCNNNNKNPSTNNNNNNHSNNNNNNNDGEPKYLHKKFKKMATVEVSSPLEIKKESAKTIVHQTESSEVTRRGPSNDVTKNINNNNNSSSNKESSKAKESSESGGEPVETKKTGYVCPYCKLSCSKPSVLQKHIRAHTNERPYPCLLCGFAFKTKSNLYKHRRSRAHSAKAEGTADQAGKVSEDSDISLSDSASNGTGTPPPLPSSVVSSSNQLEPNTKTVKTGKIYKPKFHTALESVNNETGSLSVSSVPATATSTSSSSLLPNGTTPSPVTTSIIKPNPEQLQEHIDKIITDNQAIVEAVDPRLHKLMQRQQPQAKSAEQPLNLSSSTEETLSLSRKRCYSESFVQDKGVKPGNQPINQGSIIKDLLLKNRASANDDFVCTTCKISYTSADNLEAHRRYYCKGSSSSSSLSSSSSASPSPSPKREFQLDLEKRDELDSGSKSAEYYNSVKPLPSPGPLLGNTRLVDAYAPAIKKHRLTDLSVPPTSLRSLEELSKYPRPNSLQMFGGQVRILDNTGETKTMRIEPRQTNSPTTDDSMSNHNGSNSTSGSSSETSSIVVRSSLHSGGTMVHKPPGGSCSSGGNSVSSSTTTNCSLSNSISMAANAPKMLAPIIPNISTPNIAPTMTCYGNYLEPRLNPLTITAYNPLTLPQSGITSILHGGKIIPYVPGMPGPHTLMGTSADISQSVVQPSPTDSTGYKIVPGIPGLEIIPGSQPLDLASPVKGVPPYVPGIPGPMTPTEHDQMKPFFGPLDLAKDTKVLGSFKHPNNGSVLSPKVINQSVKFDDKYRRMSSSSNLNNNNPDSDTDRHILKNSKYKLEPSSRKDNCCYDNKNFKTDNINSYSNGTFERTSPKLSESRKRPASWGDADNLMMMTNDRVSPSLKYDSLENGRSKMSPETVTATVAATSGNLFLNGSRPRAESVPPVIIMDLDTASIQQEQRKSSPELTVSLDNSKSSSSSELTQETSTKFLRPSSLPLKPGTFTPKRHHGITPTLNTLPLISPETPRPRKSYGQLYLNGHAYTYLGLKCSTRAYYCTVNRPQPMYVLQRQTLSMYSNWKIFNQPPQDLELDHYDSRNRPSNYTTAGKNHEAILTHSSQRPAARLNSDSSGGQETDGNSQKLAKRIKIFDGGFESNEDYTYVRGRGRGRYVCEECGIRCKKPSMLKKHIRTHTDVRPYTCKYCAFSFKTKGNLTKHMKSKAHYKKCRELGIDPVPTTVCDENIDKEAIARLVAGGGENPEESSDEEEETDADESEESGSEEHEAAQSLLSLSQLNQSQSNSKNNTGSASRVQLPPGLLPASRPTTYPYTLTTLLSTTTSTTTTTTATASLAATTPSTSAATVIQSESCNRYYFPSSRSLQDNSRDSVIRSTKVEQQDTSDDVPPEHSAPVNGEGIEDQTTRNIGASQPMDLSTTKVTPGFDGCVVKRSSSVDILTPVSEPILMQTIVQTMERLPPQGREWKPDAEGHMLQAYLTERHVMDSKIKQQYRVGGASKHENNKKQIVFSNKLENCFISNSRNSNLFSNSTPTVTYTDPSRMHHHLQQQLIVGTKKEDPVKVEVKTSERRPFDIDSLHYPLTNTRDNQQQDILRLSARANQDYSPLIPTRLNYPPEMNTRELIAHEQIKNSSETRENGVASHERQDFTPSPNREPTTPSRYERPPSAATLPEFKVPCSELKPIISQEREQIDSKPGIEYRVAMEPSKILIPDVNLARQGHAVADARNNSDRVAVDVKINIDSLNKQAVGGCAVNVVDSIKQQQHNVARKMVVGGPGFRSPSPSRGNGKPMAEFLPPSSIAPNYVSIGEDGRSTCGICNKVFNKPSQLKLHINIHYFERPFRCESCAVSFRTKGHLTKHERSVSHHNKVSMTSTFGAATTTNPRPFKCTDCKIAFRIHGHLAKHLRSKMHIMKLECIGKLPFGTYAEMERSGVNLNDIDTTDCDNSLASLQMLAKKLYDQDPSKIGQWDTEMIPAYHQATTSGGETSSDEGEPIHPLPATTAATTSSPSSFTTSPTVDISSVSRAYHHLPNLVVNEHNNKSAVESHVPNSRFDDNNLSSSSSSSSSLPYKCQMCAASYRTGGELQVHCFVEHNVDNRNHDSGKENTHIKISNEDTSNVHDKNDDT